MNTYSRTRTLGFSSLFFLLLLSLFTLLWLPLNISYDFKDNNADDSIGSQHKTHLCRTNRIKKFVVVFFHSCLNTNSYNTFWSMKKRVWYSNEDEKQKKKLFFFSLFLFTILSFVVLPSFKQCNVGNALRCREVVAQVLCFFLCFVQHFDDIQSQCFMMAYEI